MMQNMPKIRRKEPCFPEINAFRRWQRYWYWYGEQIKRRREQHMMQNMPKIRREKPSFPEGEAFGKGLRYRYGEPIKKLSAKQIQKSLRFNYGEPIESKSY